MPFILFVLALFLLGLLTLRLLRLMKTSSLGADEPAQLPAVFGWSLAIAIIALNLFAYDVDFGIGYGLFGVCVFAAILLLFPPERRGREVWFLTITGMMACALFGFRANEFVQIVNMVTAIACAGALLLLRSIGTVRWHGLWLLKMKVGFLVRILHRLTSFGGMFRSAETARGTKMLHVLRTVGITLIVLLFFSWILSAADPVFDQWVRAVREQALGRTILSAVLLLGLLLFAAVTVPVKWQEKVPQLTLLSFWEVFVPAVSLAFLFGLFLFVQAKYLFGTHADFRLLAITYAEYVRRGFVELLIASLAGSVLSYIIILKQRALTSVGHIRKLQWVNGVLLVELLFLLASAAKRDWMYIDIYGLTRVRIIGAIFLLWILAMIALLFALNARRSLTERSFLGGGAIASALVVLLLNAINIDAVIASATPPRDQRHDIVYISRLSSDAAQGWMTVIDEANARYESLRTMTEFSEEEKMLLAEAKIALNHLEVQLLSLGEEHPWQEWNVSRLHAVPPFTQVRCVLRGIRTLQRRTQTDLYTEESSRLYENTSPFVFESVGYQPESLADMGDVLVTDDEIPPLCEGATAL